MLRILHLSDIHFGQEKNREPRHNDVREQLVADLARLLGDDKSLDLILVNGDIAYSGKKIEYNRAVEWLDRIITVGRCDETAVLTVPGNHDIDCDLISLASRQVHAHLRNSPPETVKLLLHDYSVERDEVNSLFPKLGTYLDFARGYNSEFDQRDIPRWIRYRDLGLGYRLRLIGLCSVLVSDLDDRLGKMILGERQYIFPEDRSVITLVMVHHPIAWLLDRVGAKPYLTKRTSILLAGHEHVPDLEKVVTLSGVERIEISAGAITATKSEAPFEFAYNLIELDVAAGSNVLLETTVWPRIWSVQGTRFVADTGKTGEGDSKTLSINCGLKPIPAEQVTMCAENGSRRGIEMPQEVTADFGRLNHFFWHYLNWQQRITVLIRAAVLPESVESRLPQTIELEALQRARDAGKLASVWNETMSFVPEEKRKPNPFKGDNA